MTSPYKGQKKKTLKLQKKLQEPIKKLQEPKKNKRKKVSPLTLKRV
jgi:hypothetical protein